MHSVLEALVKAINPPSLRYPVIYRFYTPALYFSTTTNSATNLILRIVKNRSQPYMPSSVVYVPLLTRLKVCTQWLFLMVWGYGRKLKHLP